MKIDKKIIKELSDYLDEFNLTELEYTEKDTKIKVSKNNISINNQTNQTLSKEIKRIEKKFNFSVEDHRLELFGKCTDLCENCS